ncbi:glutamine synthetase family protein [Chloroflexi bacterium TSY]|nr:glutamine synthetase family protein [Chloroflexi bacterium TSY]
MTDTYKRIRTLFPDHLSLARGKYIRAHLANEGARFCITLFALTYDRDMCPAPGARLLEGLPDCDLLFSQEDIRPSWQPNTGIVVGDLMFHGEPLMIGPRNVLKKAMADWDEMGYAINVGIELEAFVLQPDGEGGWTEWDTPGAYVYGTGPDVDPIGLMDEIWETADLVGFPVESINSEYDTPAFELTLRYGECLETVDNIFLFKLMAREIAMQHGLRLTFTGKPFGDRGGSGLHVNFSLVDQNGNNAMVNSSAADGISPLAKQCIAGLVDRHEAMSALCASTVNAYKRLQPAQLAGYWANWGYDHRGVTVRIPHNRGKATRIEHRMPDGAASPYLATAAVLQAARLGVVNKTLLPPAEEQDCLESQSTDRHVPDNLALACDVLEADTEFVDAFGRESVEQLIAVKRFEWEKYTEANPNWSELAETVTDWELNYYTPFI